MTRNELIAALEQTEVGSREMSDEVLTSCGWYHRVDKRLPDREQWGWLAPGSPPVLVMSDPSPTECPKNAMTLVPEGWSWVGGSRTPKGFGVQLGKLSIMNKATEVPQLKQGTTVLDDQDFLVRGAHKSLALAWCIAALRARNQP